MIARAVVALVSLIVAIGPIAVVAQRGGAVPAAPPLVRENATERISDHVYAIPDNGVSMVPTSGSSSDHVARWLSIPASVTETGRLSSAKCRKSARPLSSTWRPRTFIPSTISAPVDFPPTPR